MNYLEITRKAIQRSGAREELPDTLVDANGLVSDFAVWVADGWEELQISRVNPPWWFRVMADETISLVDGTSEYSLPADLATVDWNTVSVYLTAGVDEKRVKFIEYDDYRMTYGLRSVQEGWPNFITTLPSGEFKVIPTPEQAYTLRFDGVRAIDELEDDDDEPAGLPEEFHKMLSWKAIQSYALHHEDGPKMAEANEKYNYYYYKLLNRGLLHGVDLGVRRF